MSRNKTAEPSAGIDVTIEKSLRGKTAVITGAGSGIGRAIALELARAGAIPIVVGRTISRLEAVAAEARALDTQAVAHSADLSKASDVDALAQRLGRDFESVDVLVHNAGMIALGTMEEVGPEVLDDHYRVNVRGPYQLTRALLPKLRESRGQVVFVNSSAGLAAKGGAGAYCASKHALKAVADSLRDEVNASGIRVLSVYPGRTASPMQKDIMEAEGRPYHPELLLQPEDVASALVHSLRLPRTAELTDLNIRPMLKG